MAGDRGEPQSVVTGGGDGPEGPKPKSRMAEGALVYVRDPHYSWIPAIIESGEDEGRAVKVRVSLPPNWEEQTVPAVGRGAQNVKIKMERTVKLCDYLNDELPLQNLESDGITIAGKKDMADLAHLHEAAILYNLKARHADSMPYTRVGDILVAVNPFRWIDGLYSEERRGSYAEKLIWLDRGGELEQSMGSGSDNGGRALATAAAERKAVGYDYEKLGIEPHVYETSSLCYLGLSTERNDQTVLVTGESGAGKTETIKILMNHLATVEKSRPAWPESDRAVSSDHGSDTVARILQSNPLFEAFGNAKTTRNDNSSRFGKFTQLLFDVEADEEARAAGRSVPSCHLAGSRCITYLLEKSRVVSAGEGERGFHVFYQMLGAPVEERNIIWEGLVDVGPSDFRYLGGASPDSIDGLASPKYWPETVASLSAFGVSGDGFLDVMRSLCVILQLGNLSFGAEVIEGTERAVVSSTEELERLIVLMGVPRKEMEEALTSRVMTSGREEFTVFLSPNEARDGCDALAKETYARVFDFLVAKCNGATEPKGSSSNEYGAISLLDIFGFESFKVNRFEQLCINYANERLQYKYVMDNFSAIKNEYQAEGIDVFDVLLVDNTDVVKLLEGKLGLITQLNEECVRKAGGDESFVYKFKLVNSDSDHVILDPLHFPYEFGIKHYAAPTKYDARMFIERNLDKIPGDLMKCACQSTNPLIGEEFQRLSDTMQSSTSKPAGPKKRSEATKHLVVSKFKDQLTSLMSLVEGSRTRYIRCIKPNKKASPRMMDHSHTSSQLESAGLVTAIVISRESFPNKLSYEVIMDRFRFLTYKFGNIDLASGDIKADAETLLNRLLDGVTADSYLGRVKPFACGKTKVYFRAGALEIIETVRQEHYVKAAVRLQAWIRSIFGRKRFLTVKRGVILLQSESRRWLARRSFAKKLRITMMVQRCIRKFRARKELFHRRRHNAAAVIQASWRSVKQRRRFRTVIEASIRLQSYHRRMMAEKALTNRRSQLNEQKALARRVSVIQQTLGDVATVEGELFTVEVNLKDEVETTLELLQKDIADLRKENGDLKTKLAGAESEKREIANHASSVDDTLAASKVRIEQLGRTNMTLLGHNNDWRKENRKLKNALHMQQEAYQAEMLEMRAEFEATMNQQKMEMKAMQQSLLSSAASHERELQTSRDEADRKDRDHRSQLSRMRKEIKASDEAHQDYMLKLMGALETTHENRRVSLSVPDSDILKKKDHEIAQLKYEMAKLRLHAGESARTGASDENEKKARPGLQRQRKEFNVRQVNS